MAIFNGCCCFPQVAYRTRLGTCPGRANNNPQHCTSMLLLLLHCDFVICRVPFRSSPQLYFPSGSRSLNISKISTSTLACIVNSFLLLITYRKHTHDTHMQRQKRQQVNNTGSHTSCFFKIPSRDLIDPSTAWPGVLRLTSPNAGAALEWLHEGCRRDDNGITSRATKSGRTFTDPFFLPARVQKSSTLRYLSSPISLDQGGTVMILQLMFLMSRVQ